MSDEQVLDLGEIAMAEWTVLLGERVITHFAIHEGTELTIGRGDEADITIDNPAISRIHASLELKNGTFFLTDLKSTNGTTVNGERISDTVMVSEQDTIFLGKFQLVPRHVEGPGSSSYATSLDLEDQTVFVSSPTPPENSTPGGHQEEHFLKVISGLGTPGELPLAGKSSVKIGKDPSCDIVIPGFLVAKSQCFIVGRKGRFFIVPQRSWTATKLNDVIIKKERMLRKGDIIEIRRTKIRFE